MATKPTTQPTQRFRLVPIPPPDTFADLRNRYLPALQSRLDQLCRDLSLPPGQSYGNTTKGGVVISNVMPLISPYNSATRIQFDEDGGVTITTPIRATIVGPTATTNL